MSRENKVHTVVLTSSENYVWTSMQEIIPSIEEVWKLSESNTHSVSIINVDKKSISQIFSLLIKADNVVFTCFTSKLSIIARRVRTDLQIYPRYIFHLHSLATIALWPIYKWGMGSVLQKQDIFISTCDRDKECFHLSVPEGNNHVIPFSLSDLNILQAKPESPLRDTSRINVVYVGRLSAQKNIHTLIYAFHLLLDRFEYLPDFHFHIFGGEDNLGSPNMELYRNGYESFLQKLIADLNIEDKVSLHGFVDRNILHNNYLNSPHILVSSSLHSDENFGIAALRSLSDGNMAVLSDWGGHTDHKIFFPKQVELTPVYTTSLGPVINPLHLKEQLAQSLLKFCNYGSFLPNRYQKVSIAEALCKMACSTHGEYEPLKISDLVKEVLSKQEEFFAENQNVEQDILDRRKGCKIFQDYSDKLAHNFFKSYGMVHSLPRTTCDSALIPPWVNVTSDTIIVSDFHKGDFIFDRTDGDHQFVDYQNRIHHVSKECFEDLVNAGFAFTGPLR